MCSPTQRPLSWGARWRHTIALKVQHISESCAHLPKIGWKTCKRELRAGMHKVAMYRGRSVAVKSAAHAGCMRELATKRRRGRRPESKRAEGRRYIHGPKRLSWNVVGTPADRPPLGPSAVCFVRAARPECPPNYRVTGPSRSRVRPATGPPPTASQRGGRRRCGPARGPAIKAETQTHHPTWPQHTQDSFSAGPRTASMEARRTFVARRARAHTRPPRRHPRHARARRRHSRAPSQRPDVPLELAFCF